MTVWQGASKNITGTLKVKQLKGIQPLLILLFTPFLLLLWDVKMSSVKKAYVVQEGIFKTSSTNTSCSQSDIVFRQDSAGHSKLCGFAKGMCVWRWLTYNLQYHFWSCLNGSLWYESRSFIFQRSTATCKMWRVFTKSLETWRLQMLIEGQR